MIRYQEKDFTLFESQLYQTTSIVIHADDCIVIVDPNLLPIEVEEIRQFVNEIKDSRPIYLLFTHSHWDHIIGYGVFPEATVIARDVFKDREDKENILKQLKDFDVKHYISRDYPNIYPHVDIVVYEEGQVLEIGNTSLTFYKADGHCDDAIFIVVEPLGLWIAGDYFSDVETPSIHQSNEAYVETLEKTESILENHDIRFLITGHGKMADSKEEILKRKLESLNYIEETKTKTQ